MSSSYYLGIDTGGTFTDGVLLDPQKRQVVKKAKVLTTHQDLSLCIDQIITVLTADSNTKIGLVSLSTTLATNSIAEGKSRPVALFLLGYDPDLVYKFKFDRQFGSSPFFFVNGRHDLNGRELEPLDRKSLESHLRSLDGQVEAVAFSSFAGTRNPEHEEMAAHLAHQTTHLPVVQGHQLSVNLDSIRRATTARLNASLLSTAYSFMQTVQDILIRKGLHCPLYVVKGDGSLATADYCADRPVEMIHSGPATSAIGGSYLAGTASAMVIDIGGTTTDLALTGRSGALAGEGEASVGDYRTGLRTIRAHSFGLGGDSLIRFDPHGQIKLGPERAVPLAYLASQYPEVRADLLEWLSNPPPVWYSDRLEYWFLRRNPVHLPEDPRARKALELLQAGPIRARSLLKKVGAVSPVQIGAAQLFKQDILTRSGLTPTDLLHVTGEFSPWDTEVAGQIALAAARQWCISTETFIAQVRETITRRITSEVLRFLTGAAPSEREYGFGRRDLSQFLFDENIVQTDPFIGVQFQLKVPIVGIGAPARAFLPPVAEALHTEIHFPEHFEVANAVGTVVGNILARVEAEIFPWAEGGVLVGFMVRTTGVQRCFEKRAEALAFAREILGPAAVAAAQSAGALSPVLDIEEIDLPGEMARVVALAAGKPG